jgi:hypothetical protein
VIDQSARPMIDRLSPVRCGRCNWPVAHMNRGVPGAETGGLCTRCTSENGKQIKVYTFVGVVLGDKENPAS